MGQVSQGIGILEPSVVIVERCLGRDIETLRAYSMLALEYGPAGRGRDIERLLSHIKPWLADILLSLSRSEEAIAVAEKIVATRHGSSCMMALSMAERIWGSALSHLGKDAAEVDAHLRNSLSIADSVGNVLEALDTEIAWGQAMLERQNPTGARTYFHRARARLTDEMLPLARDRFLRTLAEGLTRCEPS